MNGELNVNNNKITNLPLPTNIEDVANKQCADSNFLRLDGTNIINVPDAGLDETAAVNKKYVDNNFLKLAGGQMVGAVDMNSNRLKNVPPPVDSTDAANKAFVDLDERFQIFDGRRRRILK